MAEIPLTTEPSLSNANACKALVMRFLIALKEKLGWDPDDTFTVSQLYLNDTNGFVRVIRTVNKLLDLLAECNILIDVAPSPRRTSLDFLGSPSDQRTHVVRELLESERKYVHDLEIMQNYATMLAQTGLVMPDTIYLIFGNLNQLVDVQRRFLICVEDNARRPAYEQRFGGIFRDMEEDFAVYEPFCANYAKALEVICNEANNLSRAKLLPAAQNYFLDPSYELPTFMIKPVQRICKYPLLLEQLLKSTARDAPWYDELADAMPIIKRITDKVNETSRRQENLQAVHDLELRVEDWKGHSLKSFGNLLHSDVFLVSKGESEREFQVYLFEKILLCCKDLGSTSNASSNPLSSGSSRGRSKNNSLLKQRQNSISNSSSKKDPKSPLQLKGRIFMNNIVGINAVGRPGGFPDAPIGSYSLQVWWRGESEVESFSLRCKNEEQLRLWQGALQKLLDDLTLRRQQSISQATTPTSGPPHLPHLNLSGTQYSRHANRGGFMQVATPVVATPDTDGSLPRRFTQRNRSQSSQRSEEDGMGEAPASAVAPAFPTPTRSYTESDVLTMMETKNPSEESGKSLQEEWKTYTPRVPRDDPQQATFGSSPKSISSQGRAHAAAAAVAAATAAAAPAQPPQLAPASSNPPSVPLSPRSSSHMLGRSSSAAPISRPRPKMPAQLAIPPESLEQDILGMNISSIPVQRMGFGASRAAVNPLQGSVPAALSMARAASDGVAVRAVAPEETPMPPSASPQNDWNPYFPSIPGSSGPAAPYEGHNGSLAMEPSRSAPRSRAESPAQNSPVLQRKASEGGILPGPGSSSSVVNAFSGVDPYRTPTTPSSPPTAWSPLQVRLIHGNQLSQFAMSETGSLLALREQIQDHLPARPSGRGITEGASNHADETMRLYYMDEDGDRVLMLDDDDLAMALDHRRIHRRNQLDVIVD